MPSRHRPPGEKEAVFSECAGSPSWVQEIYVTLRQDWRCFWWNQTICTFPPLPTWAGETLMIQVHQDSGEIWVCATRWVTNMRLMVSGGRSPTPVKTQAECEEPFAPTVSLVIGIIFACSVRGAWSKERSQDLGTCTTRGREESWHLVSVSLSYSHFQRSNEGVNEKWRTQRQRRGQASYLRQWNDELWGKHKLSFIYTTPYDDNKILGKKLWEWWRRNVSPGPWCGGHHSTVERRGLRARLPGLTSLLGTFLCLCLLLCLCGALIVTIVWVVVNAEWIWQSPDHSAQLSVNTLSS